MKNIIEVAILLSILIFSNQSNTYDLDVNLASIETIIIENIIDINNEKKTTKTEINDLDNGLNNIFGPYETELIQEVLISIFRCKTITDYLYSLPDFNIELKYNKSEILDIVKSILKSKSFSIVLIRIFNKINIFNFEVWIKIIRIFIEKITNLPAISENKFEYVINYNDGSVEFIPKEKIEYYYYRNQKRLIKTNELLNHLEKFIFYCFKFYSFATFNSFDDYIERFAGTTFGNLFNGLSPITYLFQDYFKEIANYDVYMEQFFIDVSNSLSKYLYRKLGFKVFLNIIKNFFGPIGFTIDVATFSFNLGYSLFKSFIEYIES